MAKKGKSKAPLYLGILGAAVMAASAIISIISAIGGLFEGLTEGEFRLWQTVVMITLAALPVVCGFIGAMLYRKKAMLSAILLFVSAAFALGAWSASGFQFSIFAVPLIAFVSFTIGGVISFRQR